MDFTDDYIDPDVAYLLGLIVARGTIVQERGLYQITVEFPYQNLEVEVDDLEGDARRFNIPDGITLGLVQIQQRVQELLNCDVDIVDTQTSRELVLKLTRKTIGFRNLLLQLDYKTSFRDMAVPQVLYHETIPYDVRMEFVRGFADVAGNIRRANRYVDGRNRVRLDALNDNWHIHVRLCNFIQTFLGVPVQLITWGHPNMGRGFREHQLNIFVVPFEKIGFTFRHKQQVLELLAEQDRNKSQVYKGCPGRRRNRDAKARHMDEDLERLPDQLRGRHFDAYWQICKALGCEIEPSLGPLFEGSEAEAVEEG